MILLIVNNHKILDVLSKLSGCLSLKNRKKLLLNHSPNRIGRVRNDEITLLLKGLIEISDNEIKK